MLFHFISCVKMINGTTKKHASLSDKMPSEADVLFMP